MRKMDAYLATGIAEGFEQPEDGDEVIAAWQYLVDTGLAWKLQGWFGRTAMALIDAGEILPYPRNAQTADSPDAGTMEVV